MHPARRTSLTLASALLLGVALGLAGLRGKTEPPEVRHLSAAVTDPAAASAGPESSRDDAVSSSSTRKREVSSPDAYATAWELLQQRDLRRSERQDLETKLLEEWSKIDLRAALHAAFAWDPTYGGDPFRWSPVDACLEEVDNQPDLVWELISSREYGLRTSDLRGAWLDNCVGKKPLEVLRRLPDLPAEERAHAIFNAIYSTHDPDEPAPGKDAVVAAVLALRGTPDEAAAMEGFAKGLARVTGSSDLAALMLDSPDPELREVYLMAYAFVIERGGPSGESAHLDPLPPGLRAEVEAVIKARREKQ